MSMYWAGYSAVALVLNERESYDFIEKYCKENLLDEDELWEVFEEDTIRNYDFAKSSNKGNFHIVDITYDCCEGAVLFPFFSEDNIPYHEYAKKNGKDNYIMPNGNCYMIVADRDMCSIQAFSEPVYHGYEELLNEFKGKMERYLPEDFKWNEHIGIFDYACFA